MSGAVLVAEIAEGISRKVRKVREVSIGNTLAAEASKNLFRRIARPSRGFADILSAEGNKPRSKTTTLPKTILDRGRKSAIL